MMKKISFLFLIFSLLIACNKDDEPSPEDWTVDDNIFRCKVNGEDWKPEGDGAGFAGGNLDIYYENFFNNGIQILATKDNDIVNQTLDLFVFVDNRVVGNYDILNDNVFADHSCGNYFRDTLSENKIEILAIDSTFYIIEGKFDFEGYSSNCPINEVKVTEGYFKAKYRN